MSNQETMRMADKPRGPQRFPHWHDSPEWAKHTTMNRLRFLEMSPQEFADWAIGNRDDAIAFFYAMRWPEAMSFLTNSWLMETCYPGLLKHEQNWPTVLLKGVHSGRSKLHVCIREILEDRLELVAGYAQDEVDYDEEERKDWAEFAREIEETLDSGSITDAAESVLMDYGTRDGYEGCARYINRALALAGRLRKAGLADEQNLGRPLKTCQVNGESYYAAV